jgi:transposase
MTLHPDPIGEVPGDTAHIVHLIFPKGDNFCLKLRQELGTIFQDELFKALFAGRGQPAEAPWRLALVSVLQFMEGLTDRQAAEAVRTRLDWKYLLNLELSDTGFHFSVLSEFRSRLVEHQAEEKLLETVLTVCKQKGWLKENQPQRTDATHIVGAARKLNRLGCVHETLRHALNVLATVAPRWLSQKAKVEWFERYSTHLESFGLCKKETNREVLAQRIGEDGWYLLQVIYQAAPAMSWLKDLESVEILRQVWLQQYLWEEEQMRFRQESDTPPAALEIISPHDPQMRAGAKRHTQWMGYKVHLTESCAEQSPQLITHVETTPASEADGNSLAAIHEGLAGKGFTPHPHLVDAAYPDAENLVTSRQKYSIELLGPVPADLSWQAQAKDGFAASDFEVDWEKEQARCPAGQISTRWWQSYDRHGKQNIKVGFAKSVCQNCVERLKCSRDIKTGRIITLRPNQEQYEALQEARARQKTSEFREQYRARAGIEGTISQAVNKFELRQSRYVGFAKVHLQHVLTATALNLARIEAWLMERPRVTGYTSRFAQLGLAS